MDLSQIYIQRIGKVACSLLESGSGGKVLAGFSNAAYLYSDRGELFWLGTATTPLHRRCIQTTGPLPRLMKDTPFTVRDRQLLIGFDTALDFGSAPIWEAPSLSPAETLTIDDIPARVRETNSILDNLPEPAGFGSLIPAIIKITQTYDVTHPPLKLSAMPAFAWPVVEEIAIACLSHNSLKIFARAGDLIGLGEGLTPSGDDFVGGLLFCINKLQSLYPDFSTVEFPDPVDFIESKKPCTHLISFTILRDHALGHSVEFLHLFIDTLLTRRSPGSMGSILTDLIQIGHSTGWDMLAGVLTGLLLVLK
jgi:hypothetical protein